MWKPAYDFLYSWSLRYGDSYRDMIQDLHLVLDKMKNPATRQWRQLTGALITVNCLDIFRASAYPNSWTLCKRTVVMTATSMHLGKTEREVLLHSNKGFCVVFGAAWLFLLWYSFACFDFILISSIRSIFIEIHSETCTTGICLEFKICFHNVWAVKEENKGLFVTFLCMSVQMWWSQVQKYKFILVDHFSLYQWDF